MKKILILTLTAILGGICSHAQDYTLRASYIRNGFSYISAEPEPVSSGNHTFWTKLEYVGYPNSGGAYALHLYLEEKTERDIPKGASITVNTLGKRLTSKQIGDSQEHRSFDRGSGSLYWNKAMYMFEEEDVTRMIEGITAIDIVTGFGPDDYIQVSFPEDELAKVLNRQYEAIKHAPVPPEEVNVDKDLFGVTDANNSFTAKSRFIVSQGKKFMYISSLTYLYYKNSNREDFEITLQIGTETEFSIPYGNSVRFTLDDGSQILLRQEREGVNTVVCYPDSRQLKAMTTGVEAISVETESGTLTDRFENESFASALARQYRALMAVSVM